MQKVLLNHKGSVSTAVFLLAAVLPDGRLASGGAREEYSAGDRRAGAPPLPSGLSAKGRDESGDHVKNRA